VLLLLAAEAGLSPAQYTLGWIFTHEKGVEANPVKAFEWFQKGMLSRILQNINTLSALLLPAAEAGHSFAQYNLGWMYYYGKGVEANPAKAVEWYQKGMLSRILQNINTLSALPLPAAEAGNQDARLMLQKRGI
jgi:Sel1 repeat